MLINPPRIIPRPRPLILPEVPLLPQPHGPTNMGISTSSNSNISTSKHKRSGRLLRTRSLPWVHGVRPHPRLLVGPRCEWGACEASDNRNHIRARALADLHFLRLLFSLSFHSYSLSIAINAISHHSTPASGCRFHAIPVSSPSHIPLTSRPRLVVAPLSAPSLNLACRGGEGPE
ncbi:hypothetical protein DL93DRAFT_1564443 [Clavulina sp. PMI_390]|nr:hypothetical protein DL93DRAFT_1564443 [Clavulina sp. PMI_390]